MEITLDLLSRLRGNTYVTTAVVIVGFVVFFYFNYSTQPFRGIPYVGGPKWDILNIKAQYRFVTDCKNLIKEGLAKVRELNLTNGRDVAAKKLTTAPRNSKHSMMDPSKSLAMSPSPSCPHVMFRLSRTTRIWTLANRPRGYAGLSFHPI